MRHVSALTLLIAVCISSCELEPHLVLTIEAGAGVPAEFDTVHVGTVLEDLRPVRVDRTTLPVQITVSRPETGDLQIWVETRGGDSVLGRGATTSQFRRSGTPTGRVVLSPPCDSATECDDGLFCTGEEQCVDHTCRNGDAPCQPSFGCDLTDCVEASASCSVTVDHSLCPTGEYCNTRLGCVPGVRCITNEDCQLADGSVCNGAEECEDNRCVPGSLPVLDDANICTFDGCNDALTDPVFHQPDPGVDGNACPVDATTTGICVAARGGCVVTSCGDGFVDALGGEQCDDDNTVDTDACPTTCLPARCGDGFVWGGIEVCDDGSHCESGATCTSASDCAGDGDQLCKPRSGDGCRADCLKDEICGDGTVDVAEDCDDGNTNPNDACDASVCLRVSWRAHLVTGLGLEQDEGAIQLTLPRAIAVDRWGNRFIADTDNNRVIRRDAETGAVTTIAGGNGGGSSGDGGPATAAKISWPRGVAVDGSGQVFVATNTGVRKIDVAGIITTIAGGFESHGVAVDGGGRVYATNYSSCTVLEIDDAGVVSTLVGGGMGYSGDYGPAIDAELWWPTGIAVDHLGRVFIADSENNAIRMVDTDGIITTVAGGNPFWGEGCTGDWATNTELANPIGVSVGDQGQVYFTDFYNHAVCVIDSSGWLEAFAGKNSAGYSGDGGPAWSAQLREPQGVFAHGNEVFIADSGNDAIRRVDASYVITTVEGGDGAPAYSGDGGAATATHPSLPRGIFSDGLGQIFIADTGNAAIRRIDTAGIITTVAGGGNAQGDGGLAADAIIYPTSVFVDDSGQIYLTDRNAVRKVDAAGVITTIAGGNLAAGYSGNGGPATAAALASPNDVFVDDTGQVFILDSGNDSIRKVDSAGIITGVGTATNGESMAVDGDGEVYYSVFDSVRKTDDTVVAGGNGLGYSGDNGPATAAQLNRPYGIFFDSAGQLFIADRDNDAIRRVDAAGTITTVAGGNGSGATGDGGPATAAQLNRPVDVFVDGGGQIFIVEYFGFAIRKVDSAGVISTLSGFNGSPGDGPTGTGRLGDPRAMAPLGSSRWLVSDGARGRIRMVDVNLGSVQTVAGYPTTRLTSTIPGADAYHSRLLQNADGLVAVPVGALVSERDGNTLRLVNIPDAGDPSTWSVSNYAGVLPASVCASAGVPADPECADDSAGHVDGAISTARFDGPAGMAYDAARDIVYLADSRNHVIRVIDVSNDVVSTIAGTPRTRGYFGEGVVPTTALLDEPRALAIGPNASHPNGSVYIADTGNHRVRRLDLGNDLANPADDTIATVLGDGVPASSGSGEPAKYFPVDTPLGLTVDPYGNLFVTSSHAVRLVHAGADGVADGSDRVETIYGQPPREEFPEYATLALTGVSPSGSAGLLYFLDAGQGFLVELHRRLVTPELCDNGVDDNADGLTDCEEPSCYGFACVEDSDSACISVYDEDEDDLKNCEDPDCQASIWCSVEIECGDGEDDDGDGKTDCGDPDCLSASCSEVCDNGWDDDADGRIDCADPDCFDAACAEHCSDGEDNNLNGDFDCDDADCVSAGVCP